MSDLTLRAASKQDAEALSILACESFAKAFGHTMSASDLAAHLAKKCSADFFRRAVSSYTLLLLESTEGLLGYVMLGPVQLPIAHAADDLEIYKFYVHPDQLSCGHGARLMQAVLVHPAVQAAPQLLLGVWEHNHAAQRFYRRYGFEKVGTYHFPVASGQLPDLEFIRARAMA